MKNHKGALTFFFVAQLWLLSTVTTLLYTTVKTDRSGELMCTEFKLGNKISVQASAGSSLDCSQQKSVSVAKIFFAFCNMIVILIGTYFAFRLNELMEDHGVGDRLDAQAHATHGISATGVDHGEAVPFLNKDARTLHTEDGIDEDEKSLFNIIESLDLRQSCLIDLFV